MYELVYKSDVELDYCDLNNKRSIPTPFIIISEDEWRELRHRWANHYCDYKQVHDKEQLQQLFGTDSGYAEAYFDYNGHYGVAEIIKMYTNERAYIKIGCDHDWELVESDKISCTQRCKKCGCIIEIPTGV